MLTDEELLEQVSDGLPLKGIIDNEYSYQICETVLSLKSKFVSQTYLQSNEPRIKKDFIYQSVCTRNKMKKIIEKSLIKYPLCLKELKKTSNDIIKEESTIEPNENFFGIFKYFVQYFKYCVLDINKCCLTATCIDELKMLERQCRNCDDYDKDILCEKFFERFGTFINTGNLHFGGIYFLLFDCYLSYGDKDNEDVKKNLIDLCSIKDLLKMEKDNSIKELFLHVKTTNTLNAITQLDLETWIGNLEKYDNQWQLLNLGNKENYIGIWDILINHKENFTDVETFSATLKNSSESFYLNLKRKEEILRSLKQYSNDLNLHIYAKTYLVSIINWKYEIERKNNSFRLWWTLLISIEMQEFLKALVECIPFFYKVDIFFIKSYIKIILIQASDRLFNNKEVLHLNKWLEDVPSFEIKNSENISDYHLDLFRTNALKNILPLFDGTTNNDGASKKVKASIKAAAKQTLSVLNKMPADVETVFFKLMLFELNYDIDQDLFKRDISRQMVEGFLTTFDRKSNELNKFSDEGVEKAYLFLLIIAIELSMKSDQESKQNRFQEIIEKCFSEGETKLYVENYIGEHKMCTVDELRELINNQLYGTDSKDKKHEDRLISCLSTIWPPPTLPNVNESKTPFDSHIITQLGLQSFYPGKITNDDVRDHSRIDKVGKVEDIPWCFINSIISLDYELWNKYKVERCDTTFTPMQTLPASFEEIQAVEIKEDQKYHPLDIIMVVFLCCSRDVKQLLVDKMYLCRLEVPIFFRDEVTEKFALETSAIPLLRSLNGSNNAPIASESIPTISFVRVTELSISKTELMNSLLDNKSHHTFFCKSLIYDDIESINSDGLVSICKYSPPHKYKHEPTLVLNMRGKCLDSKESLNFVLKFSDLLYILIELENDKKIDIDELVKEFKGKIVFIFIKRRSVSVADFKSKYKDFLNSLNENIKQSIRGPLFSFELHNGINKHSYKFKEEIQQNINVNVGIAKTTKSISFEERLDSFEKEYDCTWSYCKLKAEEICSLISQFDLSFMEENIFPLQGDLWKNWSQLDREVKTCKPKDKHERLEDAISNLDRKKGNIRLEQCEKFNEESNSFIKAICSSIINLDINSMKYLFHWIAYDLEKLIQTKKDYYQQDKDNVERVALIEEFNINLNQNHIVRELAQVYEAFLCLKNPSKDLQDKLEIIPRFIADLFLQDTMLNIYDSTVSHIPIKFIQAVFKHLEEKVNKKVNENCHIYVISAIGIQSTGKSTLLNALFGTQFPTDAGTCTQGIYAQLFKVPRKDGFNYVMVLDTEGMRSQNSLFKDNELATLITGISDLTIVNFKGENQTEMIDILQIVSHSLVKIKAINASLEINTRYLFVYHNVEAVDAHDKLKKANLNLLETLDNITKQSAIKLEVKDIDTFSQMSNIDINKDTFYFPNVWDGVPPFATISKEYIRKVKDLKLHILDTKIPELECNFDFSNFSIRLDDLWEGIIREKFIFSFRNSLEINAFDSLEKVFTRSRWKLNEKGLSFIHAVENNAEKFNKTVMLEELENCFKDIKENLRNFFRNDKNGRILRRFCEEHEKKLTDEKNLIVAWTIDSIKHATTLKKEKDEISKHLNDRKPEVRNKAIEVAETIRLTNKKMNEEELNYEFDQFWEELKNSLSPMDMKGEDINLMIENVLRDLYQNDISLFEKHYNKPSNLTFDNLNSENENESNVEDKTDFDLHIQSINRKSKYEIDRFLQRIENENFIKHHAEMVVQITINEINRYIEQKNDFTITDILKLDMILLAMKYAYPHFKKMQENYIRLQNPFEELERKFKHEIRIRFFNTFYEIEIEQTQATIFSDVFQYLIQTKIEKEHFEYIYKETIKREPYLLSKKDFTVKMLKDLLEENCFDKFMSYIQDNDKYVRTYLFQVLDRYNSSYNDQRLINEYDTLIQKIAIRLKKIEDRMSETEEGISLSDWIALFYQEMIDIFPDIREKTKDLIDFSKESYFNTCYFHLFLQNSFNKHLTFVRPELKFNFYGVQAIESVAKLISGCNKKCPFCKAYCQSSIKNHANKCSTTHHFPIGILGGRYANKSKLSSNTCNFLINSENRFANEDTKNNKISIFRKIMNLIMYGDAMHEHNLVSFKDFQSVYESWHIDSNDSLATSLYWKWFVVQYKSDIEEYYNAKFQDIPSNWKNIRLEDVLQSLENI